MIPWLIVQIDSVLCELCQEHIGHVNLVWNYAKGVNSFVNCI